MHFPYLPADREILFVPIQHPFMQAAKLVAETESLDPDHKTGVVVVKNEVIIGAGANGSTWHELHGCERKRLKIPTGEGYEKCEGCHPRNHAEQTALAQCKDDPNGADLYLWGHWWCCQSCWDAMIAAGIRQVYLPEGAAKLFQK